MVALAAGCWRTPAPDQPPLANRVAEDRGFVMSARGVGPFNAGTRATREALTATSPKLGIVPRDLGGESGIVFDVFEGGERLFYIVPDDAPGWTDDQGGEHQYAETMFAVFAVSPRVKVEGRSWRVGEPFDDASGLDLCECWGGREVTACFRKRTHVRVIFEQRCDEATQGGARKMLGKRIDRIMWKREIETDQEPMFDELPPP